MATYSTYGQMTGLLAESDRSLSGFYDLQETPITIPDGEYRVPDEIPDEAPDEIDPPEDGVYDGFFEFDVDGVTQKGVFVGYHTSEEGHSYPILWAPEYIGGTQFILTNLPTTRLDYEVPENDFVTEPLRISSTSFSHIYVGHSLSGPYFHSGLSADLVDNIYTEDDTIIITSNGQDERVRFAGYEKDTGYPIFMGQSSHYILTNEPGTPTSSMYTPTPADIITDMPVYVCFAPGTLIATPDGERPVETLRPGDKVLTADSRVETVRWVGVQKVPTLFGPPEVTRPVRIMAGALYENTPHTDLVVTKDHGMIVNGVICHAGALVNGTSIVEVPTRELGRDRHGLVTYYHVETWNHVPLLANGAAAESFIDNVGRARFNNHAEFVAMYGENVPAMAEMTLPRAMSARQVPRRISSRLATRAAMLLPSAVRGPVGKGPVTGSA